MRVLYPSAHHDRFAHSLGVFYLGNFLFTSIKENSENLFQFDSNEWKRYQKSFEIACLMHDCAHAPFSHTFENYYLYQKAEIIKNKLYAFFANDPDFQKDLVEASSQSHELISTLVMLERYEAKIIENDGDPQLCARMILGCQYITSDKLNNKFSNRLIMLLNGTSIDVDSLDYIQRDTWASGVSNANIDYRRLLTSLMISPDKHGIPILTLKKQALSVLSSIS
jgi:hypothetical protein